MSEKNLASNDIRICHLADIHLGYRKYNRVSKTGINQREADVNTAFEEAISRIISLKPSLTVIAGDLFHSVRPSNYVVTFCFRQLRKLVRESGAPVVIVGGNHEAPRRADTGSVLQILAEIDGVFVADSSVETFTFDNLSLAVTCLPHAALEQGILRQAAISQTLKGAPVRSILRANDAFEHNILLAHAQVNEGWISDFGGVEVDIRTLAPHEWDYIALGHVHLHRSVARNAAYSGSIEHTATNIWSEAKAIKGFLEVTLPSCKQTFHPLTTPREVISLPSIDATELTPEQLMSAIEVSAHSVPGGLDGKIVRLDIQSVSRECYRHLNHKELRELRAQALHFTVDLTFANQGTDLKNVTRIGKGGLKEELLIFAKQQSSAGLITPGVALEVIESTLSTFAAKVEAKYEAT